jgi:hypothetical protein
MTVTSPRFSRDGLVGSDSTFESRSVLVFLNTSQSPHVLIALSRAPKEMTGSKPA